MSKLSADIDYLSALEKIIKTYEEIAAVRLGNVKEEVLKNRDYINGIDEIYQIVKKSYKREITAYKFSVKGNKNGKTARVFLASNTGLYGDILQRVFALFLTDLEKSACDPVIVGRMGKNFFVTTRPKREFVYFDVPDRELLEEETKEVVNFLMSYDSVIVYHGLFKNILMQEAVATDITGNDAGEDKTAISLQKLIFEPSLPRIASFFETEIFSSLMTHVILESQLAKFSARMASLETAGENIKKETLAVKLEQSFRKKRLADKKQQEMLAGRGIWGQPQ